MARIETSTRAGVEGALLLLLFIPLGGCGDDDSEPPAVAPEVQLLRCDEPLRVCGDACVDPQSDREHCGECDFACEDGVACRAGSCSDPSQEGDPEARSGQRCEGARDQSCVELLDSEGCDGCEDGTARATECEVGDRSGEAPALLTGQLGGAQTASDSIVPSCGSPDEAELRFVYTAPEAGLYSFSTTGSEVLDTVLAVFEGDRCGGRELACNDDDWFSLHSQLELPLARGQAVLVAIESWAGESGGVQLEVRASTGGDPGTNTEESATGSSALECSTRELSGPLPAVASGAVSAGPDRLMPSCALFGSEGEVLFHFTAPEAGRYRFDTRGSSSDTILQILDEDCGGEELACNDDSELGELAAIVDVELSAGQRVVVNLDSYDGTGDFALSVDLASSSTELPTGAGSEPDCCSAHDGPGCGDAAVEACVCSVDSQCCAAVWDDLCADAVEELGCDLCL